MELARCSVITKTVKCPKCGCVIEDDYEPNERWYHSFFAWYFVFGPVIVIMIIAGLKWPPFFVVIAVAIGYLLARGKKTVHFTCPNCGSLWPRAD